MTYVIIPDDFKFMTVGQMRYALESNLVQFSYDLEGERPFDSICWGWKFDDRTLPEPFDSDRMNSYLELRRKEYTRLVMEELRRVGKIK
jgi:hypothetical protein